MSSVTQRTAWRVAALVMVVLAGVSFAMARVSDVTGPVRQFETGALIPAIAVLMVVMAGYLVRGRSQVNRWY